jgi:4-amino-4-deoxy-L-arabinose transferase-like glycosyltransferase
MNVALAIFGVGISASCIWLGVRIFNRQEPLAIWAAIIIALLFYVAGLIIFLDGRMPGPPRMSILID